MVTSSGGKPAVVTESFVARSAGALLDGETWTGTDAFARPGLPTITLQQHSDGTTQDLPSRTNNPEGTEFHPDTGTLVGLEAEAHVAYLDTRLPRQRSTPLHAGSLEDFIHFHGNDLLVLRDYKLVEQGQRYRRSMQGSVLLGIISVIVLTLVLVIVGIGVKWISEGFGEHIISLVLAAALSGLGGAVAWAFRATAGASTAPSRQSPDADLPSNGDGVVNYRG